MDALQALHQFEIPNTLRHMNSILVNSFSQHILVPVNRVDARQQQVLDPSCCRDVLAIFQFRMWSQRICIVYNTTVKIVGIECSVGARLILRESV